MREIIAVYGQVILVDDDDFENLSSFQWRIDANGYATRTTPHPHPSKRRYTERMHRRILGLEPLDGSLVDHRNGVRLDNRRENLRICTPFSNAQNAKRMVTNTSGFKGVYLQFGRWYAAIQANGKRKRLGFFDSAEEAHAAYCEAAKTLHGEFARFG